jgi:hypothetical protein
MLETLNKHLTHLTVGCVVAQWISSLTEEEQTAFLEVQKHSEHIKIVGLYYDLDKEEKLPFKLTAFRSHMRGYCSCQK